MTTSSAAAARPGAKEAGKMRAEGKDYVVQDGDVLLFRFNVLTVAWIGRAAGPGIAWAKADALARRFGSARCALLEGAIDA
jgi:hypothetical protein